MITVNGCVPHVAKHVEKKTNDNANDDKNKWDETNQSTIIHATLKHAQFLTSSDRQTDRVTATDRQSEACIIRDPPSRALRISADP